jgi:predicted ATPase
MLLTSIRVQNYKRFRDTGEVLLRPGMNVFVGKNDAGKSAFVEAVSLRVGHVAHRSLLSSPEVGTYINPHSDISLTASLSGSEFQRVLAPHPLVHVAAGSGQEDVALRALTTASEQGVTVTLRLNANGVSAQLPGLPVIPHMWLGFSNNGAPKSFRPSPMGNTNAGSDVSALLQSFVRERIYFFHAERLRVGQGNMGTAASLAPDASNLPEVLNYLQTSNPRRFRRFVQHVQEVFSHITDITARPIDPMHAVIEVWDVPTETERADLAVALSASGTGLGQVLAMLYVVVTAVDPQVIVIDEPHSFLHPGAVRKLFGIFNHYKQHQYIITTHSSAAILAAEPVQLNLVRREAYEAKVLVIDMHSRDDLSEFLSEVGANVSDVFGQDRILWVEGKTEASTFPKLIRAFFPQALPGVEILAVQQTSDLELKHAEKVVQIYLRLVSAAAPLPPAVAFVFDPEDRDERELARMRGLASGIVQFLPRRMYENYLLNAGALAEVLDLEDVERRAPYLATQIEHWLLEHGTESQYLPKSAGAAEVRSDSWYAQVHGAKILLNLFGDLTEHRVHYDKIRHGIMLTDSLIAETDPPIAGLASWLASLIKRTS